MTMQQTLKAAFPEAIGEAKLFVPTGGLGKRGTLAWAVMENPAKTVKLIANGDGVLLKAVLYCDSQGKPMRATLRKSSKAEQTAYAAMQGGAVQVVEDDDQEAT